jgi:hypothetical protein
MGWAPSGFQPGCNCGNSKEPTTSAFGGLTEREVSSKLTADEAARLAIEACRSIHGEAGLAAGPAAAVARLDRPGQSYLLIPLRDQTGLRCIVQIDAETGRVESSAAVRDPSTAFLISADDALASARRAFPQVRDWSTPYLGWRPSAQTFDSMRPLWIVPHGTNAVFVDQNGRAFESLRLPGRGG